MRQYDVEIFSTDFDLIHHTNIGEVAYDYDYINMQASDITIPFTDSIMEGDYIRIIGSVTTFFGVVTGTSAGESEGSITVSFKPFLTKFDANILFDTDLQGTSNMETIMKNIIESYWKNNADSYQNIVGLNVVTTSATTDWGLNLKSDVEGIHHLVCNFLSTFIVRALEKYRIAIKVEPDFQQKKIVLSIGAPTQSGRVIEADLPNVLEKNVTVRESDFTTNKLEVWNSTSISSKITYYRHTDDTYNTSNTDRVVPVFVDSVIVTPDETNTFSALAKSEAANLFDGIQYSNLIELGVQYDDSLINPLSMEIGEEVTIISGGTEYISILTGRKYENIITLVFGNVRVDLTKILERRISNGR